MELNKHLDKWLDDKGIGTDMLPCGDAVVPIELVEKMLLALQIEIQEMLVEMDFNEQLSADILNLKLKRIVKRLV